MDKVLLVNLRGRIPKSLESMPESMKEKLIHCELQDVEKKLNSHSFDVVIAVVDGIQSKSDPMLGMMKSLISKLPCLIIGSSEQGLIFSEYLLEGATFFVDEHTDSTFLKAACEEAIRLWKVSVEDLKSEDKTSEIRPDEEVIYEQI